jgi:3-oxoacyl-[acyl-carrier-protein] synthase II
MAGKPNIDYVNAHGTSTPTNDKNETAAIKQLLADHIPLVSSTKGATGHCLGAAGTIESVISLMAMDKGILPPTLNFVDGGEDCDLDYIPNEPRKADIEYVMKNSFGFGGTNGVIIFKKV